MKSFTPKSIEKINNFTSRDTGLVAHPLPPSLSTNHLMNIRFVIFMLVLKLNTQTDRASSNRPLFHCPSRSAKNEHFHSGLWCR